MRRISIKFFIPLVCLAFVACSDDDNGTGPNTVEYPTFASSNIKEGSVYYSFDEEKEVFVWDVKFGVYQQSPDFYLNPALLGEGRVKIYASEATELSAVSSVNMAAFDIDPEGEITGGNWYDYDFMTHTLSTKGIVYMVHTADNRVVKFRIKDYEAGKFMIEFAIWDAGTNSFGAAADVTIDTGTGENYYAFCHGTVGQQSWDAKFGIVPTEVPGAGTFSFPAVLLNSEANVMAKVLAGADFDDVNATAETGLSTDTDGNYVIGTDWFNYNPETHAVTSKKDVYVLQSADGTRLKFQILNYRNNEGATGYITLQYDIAE